MRVSLGRWERHLASRTPSRRARAPARDGRGERL